MSNPWDPFPMPSRGEPDDFPLYYGMGKVIDCWERVEFGLSQIHSLFLDDRSFNSMRAYGQGRNIFRDRIAGLGQAAETYFMRSPDQAKEGEFDRLVGFASGFSDRRNEVAHGVVLDVRGVIFFQEAMPSAPRDVPQYLLVPPIYHVRKTDKLGMPTFFYSAVELTILGDRLLQLEAEIDAYIRLYWPGALPPLRVEP